ncbi:MAG: glycoside hydrolase family 127 protein [Eubacteriales bacterium]|nr:glycoside hydrolase family 127 protein [Eubacteriales bacterium]
MDKKLFNNFINNKRSKIDDRFWNKYIELVRNEMIPYQLKALSDKIDSAPKSYCLENFKKASEVVKKIKSNKKVNLYPVDKWEYKENECDKNSFFGWCFQDSDVYKWIEAVAYSLSNTPDEKLESKCNEIIDLICSAQLENGYLDTLYVINDPSKIFTNLKDRHELYCFGHLTEAAVAYYNTTGKDKLLNAAVKFADLICNTFNQSGKKGYPGHEIAELAMVKLYKTTNNKKYLDCAEFFVKQRGTKPYYFDIERNYNRTDNSLDYEYNQAHLPVYEQKEAVGHAVRGVYLYSGMADVAKEKFNEKLYTACENIWNNIEQKKMYITGGIGSTSIGEAFSYNYDLPNDLAYNETCASIGLMFFAKRMLQIKPKSNYADVMERALYNTVLSGMSEDGKSFFYVNPLEVLPEASSKDERKKHIKPTRQKWFSCACCPPNLARLISSLNEYCYSENKENIFVHLFISGKITTDKADITIKSDYINSGKVSFDIKVKKSFNLAVRIPGWCNNYDIDKSYNIIDGYAYIKVNNDTSVKIDFDIKPKLIACSNEVRDNIGKVAVMRGPIVYCLEEIDNGINLQMLSISAKTNFIVNKDLTITAEGFREKEDTSLYFEYKEKEYKKCQLHLIPYHTWGNRGENEMCVYLRVKE